MKLIIRLVFFYSLVILASCGPNNVFTLTGELGNKKEKYIFAIYDDPIGKIDTINLIDGKFEYSFIPDTITIFRLTNDSGIALPIFADKGWNVVFKGSFANPSISGNGPNDELQQLRKIITKDSVNKISQAKDFILNNRTSYASAYVLNEFFIQDNDPNIKELKDLIAQIDGHVKDCRVIDIIQKNITENKEDKSEYINYFSCKDRKNKYVSWSNKDEQFTLINIWASWDYNSIVIRDSLYNKIKALPKKDFRVLNLSIDFDKKAWEKECKEENEQWIETCDFKGWDNPVLKQLNINKLPYNILVTKNRKIITTCIYGDKLKDKIENLILENKKKK